MDSVSFSNLLTTGAFSDFTLSINGVRKRLHRAIMSERSKHFYDYFMKEPTSDYEAISINNINQDIFDTLLKWIYSSVDFQVTMDTFGPIARLAVSFQVPSLLNALLKWMNSNITGSNSMRFFFELNGIQNELKPEFMEVIINRIMRDFETLDVHDIAGLPFGCFYKVVTHPRFKSSSYKLSYSISTYLAKNRQMQVDERKLLIDLYFLTDWSSGFSQIIYCIDQSYREKVVEFISRHFRRFTVAEMSMFPQDIIIDVLMRNDIAVPNEDYVSRRIQDMTSSFTHSDKVKSRKLWQAFIFDGQPRTFQFPKIDCSNIRCLLVGSVYLDILLDLKNTLIQHGFQPQNIVCFNADIASPPLELLFQFDSVFAFTHYQFQSPSRLSELLNVYINNGGGLVYCYGFTRIDEWGCGEGELMKYLPFTRAEQVIKSPDDQITVQDDQNPIITGINRLKTGTFAPRSNVLLTEGSCMVAEYSDGVPLVAYKQIEEQLSKVIGINFYPVSLRVHRFGYDPNQPFNSLFARSILSACGASDEAIQNVTQC